MKNIKWSDDNKTVTIVPTFNFNMRSLSNFKWTYLCYSQCTSQMGFCLKSHLYSLFRLAELNFSNMHRSAYRRYSVAFCGKVCTGYLVPEFIFDLTSAVCLFLLPANFFNLNSTATKRIFLFCCSKFRTENNLYFTRAWYFWWHYENTSRERQPDGEWKNNDHEMSWLN